MTLFMFSKWIDVFYMCQASVDCFFGFGFLSWLISFSRVLEILFYFFYLVLYVFLVLFWILVLYRRYWGCEDEGEIWLNSKCFRTCVCYMYIVFYIENFTRFLNALYDLYVQSCLYRKCSECPPSLKEEPFFDSTT